jgi:hypothetical protein
MLLGRYLTEADAASFAIGMMLEDLPARDSDEVKASVGRATKPTPLGTADGYRRKMTC